MDIIAEIQVTQFLTWNFALSVTAQNSVIKINAYLHRWSGNCWL